MATEWDGERPKMRYGLTDEPSKLNLNTATREQLLALFGESKLRDVTPEQLADALIDWRDEDSDVTEPHGAESSYYMTLDPPYRAKNKPLDTVEELLTIKYFNGRILYGEDYNRNGCLDPNEDDGPEGTFPPDDGDGLLDRGLLPFVTVYSWDANSANDNKPRININAYKFSTIDKLPESVQEWMSEELVDFLAKAQKRGYKFRSVGELLGLQVWEDGSSNYDDAWKEYNAARKQANNPGETATTEPADETGETGGTGGGEGTGGTGGTGGGETADNSEGESTDETGTGTGEIGPRGTGRDSNRGTIEEGANEDRPRIRPDNARDRRGNTRDRRERDGNDARRPDRRSPNDRGTTDNLEGTEGEETDRSSRDKDRGRRLRAIAAEDETDETEAVTGNRLGGERSSEGEASDANGTGDAGNEEGTGGEERAARRDRSGSRSSNRERGGTGGGSTKAKGTPIESPVTAEEMPVLMDRLTVATTPIQQGLINVNTAPFQVLKAIPGLTDEEAQAIASRRSQIGGEGKTTTAWVVTSGALDPAKFAVTCNSMTARAVQFTADVIGFADHVGTVQRIQVVIEMQGQLAQIRYYRDVTGLGVGYPLDGDQRSEALEFDDHR